MTISQYCTARDEFSLNFLVSSQLFRLFPGQIATRIIFRANQSSFVVRIQRLVIEISAGFDSSEEIPEVEMSVEELGAGQVSHVLAHVDVVLQ